MLKNRAWFTYVTHEIYVCLITTYVKLWNICDTFRCVLDKHSTNIIIFCKLLKYYSIYLCPLPPQAKFGSRYIEITLKVCPSAIMSGPGFVMIWPKVIWASPRLLKGKVQNERNIQIFLFDKHQIFYLL